MLSCKWGKDLGRIGYLLHLVAECLQSSTMQGWNIIPSDWSGQKIRNNTVLNSYQENVHWKRSAHNMRTPFCSKLLKVNVSHSPELFGIQMENCRHGFSTLRGASLGFFSTVDMYLIHVHQSLRLIETPRGAPCGVEDLHPKTTARTPKNHKSDHLYLYRENYNLATHGTSRFY